MRIAYQFRPLTDWSGPKLGRNSSRFKSTKGSTQELLDRELSHLGAKNVVLEVDCDATEIRLDGMLRTDAKFRSAAVIVSFECKKGALRFPCNQYRDLWDNLRAIALSLEALRAVDRYGVTMRAEQYKGWQALPAPPPAAANGTIRTRDDAQRLLLVLLGGRGDGGTWAETLREAEKLTHPDRGGDAEKF